MAWTTPTTWTTSQLVTATNLNEQIRDNMGYVHSGKPYAGAQHNDGASYTTTSATFADVDATDLSKTITTTTGRVLVVFGGVVSSSAGGNNICFDVDMDGTKIGSANTDGLTVVTPSTVKLGASITKIQTGVSNGSHTFKLQWKTSGGTATLYSTTATNPVIFQVIEL